MPAILPPGLSRKKETGSHALIPYAAGRQAIHDPETRHYLARAEDIRNNTTDRGLGLKLTKSRAIYKTPELFAHAIMEYAQWCESNPIEIVTPKMHDGNQVDLVEKRKRMMTLQGLRQYMGLSQEVWIYYKKKPGFDTICKEVIDIIYNERVVGASSGTLHPGFITRLLGLSDKREYTGKDGQPLNPPQPPAVKVTIDPKKLSTEAIRELLAARQGGKPDIIDAQVVDMDEIDRSDVNERRVAHRKLT